MKYAGTGRIDLRTALARLAENALPEAWNSAHASERDFLTTADEPRSFSAIHGARDGSLAALAYDTIRRALAEGAVSSFLRMRTGSAKRVMQFSWEGGNADRFADVYSGRTSFELEGGTVSSGAIFIDSADLDAFLHGEPAPTQLTASETKSADKPKAEGARRGRPPSPDADSFWIEACRRVYRGDAIEPQKEFAAAMEDWAIDAMKKPYDGQTVRKKVSLLVAALKRPD